MKAILISGIESISKKNPHIISDFGLNSLSFYHYLRSKVCLSEEEIFFYSGKDILSLKARGLINKIRKIIDLKDPLEPLIIYYGGHGSKGEWFLHTIQRFGIKRFNLRHRDLRKALQKHRGSLIVIADCCYAMSFKEQLNKLKCKWLLLGLSPSDHLGYVSKIRGSQNGRNSVAIQIMKSWLKRMPADPKYFNGNKMVRYLKEKKYQRSNYCLYMGNDKKFHRYYFKYFFRKVKIILREGDNIDYLAYSKK